MRADEILKKMTLDEKISMLTGSSSMETAAIERFDVDKKRFSDGPHGVRIKNRDKNDEKQNCTAFPSLCSVGATWDVALVEVLGRALGRECVFRGIDMLLAPGINIKRHPVCGRNFEYVSEDPKVAGEIGAAYIRGLQSTGTGASLKHFAMNNQERYRSVSSSEVDERTMREIYLKGFEIAVKKSKPDSVMCAFNKINSIWCSENKMLLTDILRNEWGYEGFVISDWAAVEDSGKAVRAGLDLRMPVCKTIHEEIKASLLKGEIEEKDIDVCVKRVIEFALKEKAKPCEYDRNIQHKCAVDTAAGGTVLLKNDDDVLPLTSNKYKKITVVGEFGDKPMLGGMGSAEVYPDEEYITSPVEELKKRIPETEIEYKKYYSKNELPTTMLWPLIGEYRKTIENSDAVIVFVGSMMSDDTEYFDRKNLYLNPNYEMFIEEAIKSDKKVIVVIQSGSAVILGDWHKEAQAVVEMWLAGEGAGEAIADILCGIVNPSGRLCETFPNKLRTDIEYPGNGEVVRYKEGFEVGYRYYDLHPDEICYPFGHGLSYTSFEYSELEVFEKDDSVYVSLNVKNTGKYDGAEIVQIYVRDIVSTVSKPVKELKAFKKVFIKSGGTENVKLEIPKYDLSYYNVMLRNWVVESGEYEFFAGASSRDLRLNKFVWIKGNENYTMRGNGITLLG